MKINIYSYSLNQFPHEPVCNAVTPLTAVVSKGQSLCDVNLNYSVLFEIFLKLELFCQPYYNCGEKKKKIILCSRSDNFSLKGQQPQQSMVRAIFHNTPFKPALLQCHQTSSLYKNTALIHLQKQSQDDKHFYKDQ